MTACFMTEFCIHTFEV